MSLTGCTCWVVGGVGVVGRGIARGLLKAGATVIVNSRSTERLERIVAELQHPERLVTVHGSLLPDQGAAETVQSTLANEQQRQPLLLHHVVAHGAVRYWTRKRVGCDETYSLLDSEVSDKSVLDLTADEFRRQASQLAALHFSAAQQLIPHTLSSYTFVTGDGSGHPTTLRSAMGEINSHHVWGLSAALRQEARSKLDLSSNNNNNNNSSSSSSNITLLLREVRIGLPVNRPEAERMAQPRDRPLSEDIGELCAGLAASAVNADKQEEQGKLIRIDTNQMLEDALMEYHAAEDKDIEPLPSFAEFVGSL